MTKNRQSNANLLFRIIVVPATVLCAVFRKPAFQWASVGALGLWLLILLIGFIRDQHRKRAGRKSLAVKAVQQESVPQISACVEAGDTFPAAAPDCDLFLIRQINGRITEQLKAVYPAASWLWVHRPQADELRKGGAWRIRSANTDPFNYAEVALHTDGKLVITMLQAVPLKDAPNAEEDSDDLKQSEILERVDVKSWYSEEGERVLAEIVDNLNSQGHRQVLVRDDGSVVIRQAGKDEIVEQIRNFPPRIVWDEFSQLLREDDYEASIRSEGLQLAWK